MLTLVATNPLLPDLLQRSLAAIVLTLVVSIMFLARSWQPLWEFVARWPHLLGVIAGLAWWLWLSPSFVGWVIVAFNLLSVARPSWYGRPVQTP